MSELIVEKIAPQSEILDIKGALILQGNLEANGTFLSTYLHVKPNDLDIPTITINDTGGYGFSYFTDSKTLEIDKNNPNKGIKFHTVVPGEIKAKLNPIDTITIGGIQGNLGNITITPSSKTGPFTSLKENVLIETENLLVKDNNLALKDTLSNKGVYTLMTTGSILYLGSLPKQSTTFKISNKTLKGSGTSYRSFDSGSVVVRSNFHALGENTHIHGRLKIGRGSVTSEDYYTTYTHFTGNSSDDDGVGQSDLDQSYSGSLRVAAGKEGIPQSQILTNIINGGYGQGPQDEYNTLVGILGLPNEYDYTEALLILQAELGVIFDEGVPIVTCEYLPQSSNSQQTVTVTYGSWPSTYSTTHTLDGSPISYYWEEAFEDFDEINTLEEAVEATINDTYYNPDSVYFVSPLTGSGRDGQPNIMSRGSLTIGLDSLGSSSNRFFEVISGIGDVKDYASADTLLLVNDNTGQTFVKHLSSSGDLFASMSDASNELDPLLQHVVVVDTASGKFFFTGSYGVGSDGEGVGFPYSGSDMLVNGNPDGTQAVITGSLFLSGSGNITASGHISSSHFYGDLTGTASYALNASESVSSSYASSSYSASFASSSTSASFASSSTSASYASSSTSASYAANALTKFLELTDVDTTCDPFSGFYPIIGDVEADPTFGITEDTVTGQFTGLPGFIPVVNINGTKLQLSRKVASASFADNVDEATTALTGGKFQAGGFGFTTEEVSSKFQIPAGFEAYGLDSSIEGNLTISGTLAVSDAVTIADIQISSSANAFTFGSGSANNITHQMTGNLALSASTGITAYMPDNTVGFHGTSSHALTASYIDADDIEGNVNGFPFSGSAIITGSLLLSGSGDITSYGTISASAFSGSLEGTASYATDASQSVSASFASSSYSASFASSSTSASFASSSTSASFASSSNSASFASMSYSASYASSSTTASHALTASYIDADGIVGNVNGFPYSGSDVVVNDNPAGTQAVITGSLFLSGSGNITASGHISSSHFYGDLTGTASYATDASQSVSASFASSSNSASYASMSFSASYASMSFSASYASHSSTASFASSVLQNFTSLTDVPSGNGENDTPATAAENTYPNQTANFAVVVDENGTALDFVQAVQSASFASSSDSASYATFASQSETASYASNVATKFTDLIDVDDTLKDDSANPEGDTNLAGLANYIITVEPVGNKLEAVKSVKSASHADYASSSLFAITASYTIGTVEGTSSWAYSASNAVMAESASEANFASSSISSSYIHADNIHDHDFINLDDTANSYGNEGDTLVLDASNTLIFTSSAANATSASHADNSITSITSSYSTVSLFASSSTSASHADHASSSLFAITASYTIGTVEGTSSWAYSASNAVMAESASEAVHAITGGYADSNFYAHDTTIQGDLTVSGSVGIVGGGLTINDIQISSSVDAFVFGSGSTNDIIHQMTGNLYLSSSVGIMASMSANTVGFHGTSSWASQSVSASYALSASYMSGGTIEGTASYALNASESVSSSFASSSYSASFASSSTSASYASSSTSASYASSSTSASYASSSTSASFASMSYSASYASSSTTASYALSASYMSGGTIEGTASYALDASQSVSASFASSSYSASFASSSTSASYASSSTSASYIESFLNIGDTPNLYDNSGSYVLQVAPNSESITFVKTVESASFASGSDTASYALTASYISASDVEGTIDTTFLDLTDTPSVYTQSYALQATNASTLEFVKAVQSASFASSSYSASFASSSTSASYASSSTSASYASMSYSASYASMSYSASYASMSTTASYALNAQNAEGGSFPYSGSDILVNDNPPGTQAVITGSLFLSGSGNITASGHISSSHFYGDLTGTASYATDASQSVSASFASSSYSASFASSSTSASFASSSTSASYASSSTSASYASSSTSASYASSSTSASYASSSYSASYASSSTSASYASSSYSASFASSSTSASYASSSYSASFSSMSYSASYASSSTSASYVDGDSVGGIVDSSSFASHSQEIYVDTKNPNGAALDQSDVDYSILFSADSNRGNHAISNGEGFTEVGVSQSLNYNAANSRLTTKVFSSSFASVEGHIAFIGTASYTLDASQSVSASFASSSYSASFASSSTSASFASSSTSASYASSSTSSSYASSSTSASYASSSYSASFASMSYSASYASSSTSASYAYSAETVNTSSQSTHAVTGGYADLDFYAHDTLIDGDLTVSGSIAITAGLTISDVQISSSTNAFTFGSGSVNSVTHQMTGNLHLSSSVGIMASMSANTVGFHGTSSWASQSVSASYASSSTSASYASSSTSASYADTASYVIGDIEGTASWALNASESVSSSYASSSYSASFASSSTSASFASSSTSASYASSSTSASYASSSYTASYAYTASYVIGTIEGTASWALNASESVSSSYASSSYSASFASSSTSASYASSSYTASYADTASYVEDLDVTTTYLELTDTLDTTYVDKNLFVPLVRENSVSPSFGELILTQTIPSASFASSSYSASYASSSTSASYASSSTSASHALNADKAIFAQTSSNSLTTVWASYADESLTATSSISSSYADNASSSLFALTASYVDGIDSVESADYADIAGIASTVKIIADGTDQYRLLLVDRDDLFGDGQEEHIRETEGLIWSGLSNRLGINNVKPVSELHLGGVQFIDGGVFEWDQYIPDGFGGANAFQSTLPNNITTHPYYNPGGESKRNTPGIILPWGIGIYSIDVRGNDPLTPVANNGMPWSNLMSHREEKLQLDIGDPFSGGIGDMNFFTGGQRVGGGFYFNGHGSLAAAGPGFDPFDPFNPPPGGFDIGMLNDTPTLSIEAGSMLSSGIGITNQAQGSVGIRTAKGYLSDSHNALYTKGSSVISDSLIVGRQMSVGIKDIYNPTLLSTYQDEIDAGGEWANQYSGPFQFEIHHPINTSTQTSKENSAIRFKVNEYAEASTYHVNFLLKEDGFTIHNNATAKRDIRISTLQTLTEDQLGPDADPVLYPTDRIHIDNRQGTVTIGTDNFVGGQAGVDGPAKGYGPAYSINPDNLDTNQKLIVWGRTRMHGRLLITGSQENSLQGNLGSSEANSYGGPYPLFKVDSGDADDSGKYLAELKNPDDDKPKILKLEGGGAANGISFIQFNNSEGEIGSIESAISAGNTLAYNQTSDRRLKTNIKSTNELDKLLELNPVTFNWKTGGGKDIGLIAQEVDKIYPHLVSKTNEERLQMNYIGLVPMLLSGIKEQQKMINSLEERIKKLENK
jgi:hypothetical protein